MKKMIFLAVTLSGCISVLTIPPPNTAYIRDPEVLPDEPDWKDPRHIMIINNSHYFIKIRLNGKQILFQEYIRKYKTYYLGPRRVANMMYEEGQPEELHFEVRAFLAPDFAKPVAWCEKRLKIDWERKRQEIEFSNFDFSSY